MIKKKCKNEILDGKIYYCKFDKRQNCGSRKSCNAFTYYCRDFEQVEADSQ